MQYRPDAKDLILAIQEFLLKDLIPKLEGEDLLSYKTLVSWNMLGVLSRELEKETDFNSKEWKNLSELPCGEGLPRDINDFERLPSKMRREFLKEAYFNMAKELRKSKNSNTDSKEWQILKEQLQDNLAISNPRFTL